MFRTMDNFKELWNKDQITETPEISLEKQQQIRLPLEKIRANMKREYKFTIFSFPLLFLLLFFFDGFYQISIFLMLMGLAVLITVYYFSKFRVFYKKINTQGLDTYHNLLNLRYELVLNSELYKSYYLCFVPLAFSAYVLFFSVEQNLYEIGKIFLSMIFGVVFVYFYGKIWLKEMYGKYILEISELVNQMNDQQDDFQYDRATVKMEKYFSFFENTQPSFVEKFGKAGKVLHIIFWIFVFFVALFILGFIVGFFGVMFNNNF
ncbi:hypothetical protein CAPN002_16050 [Capnocytophaga stomatis]|uniref:Uncharacterized protein n=2 Tax=Capnocytophaga stomatis TaxID=1848904 RepID=A0A250FXU8_9FLAO|nr:hypothetical protein CGC58_09370 [Capnocytophaga stomatis]GIJ94387.1 hypothetical protein CAPN002_16050 [Capnocytophaga stomatis]GIM49045.1 hypothetical protein CAPN003_04970 [Capnocytophaga stomatis]